MKVVIGIVIVLVLAIGGFIAFAVMNLGGIVERAAEDYGPDYLGASVAIGSVDISLSDGSGQINEMTIGNPAGFEGPHSFHISKASMIVDVETLNSDVVVIKSLVLDGAEPAVVVKGVKDTNFQALVANLERAAGVTESSDNADSGPETKLIIDRFTFSNATASLKSDLLGDASVEIPDIVLRDVGREENGVVAAEAIKQLLQPISRKITEAVISEQSGLRGVQDRIDEAKKDPLKLLDRLRKKE